jgi:cell wall-associated NlpC family hydrolase
MGVNISASDHAGLIAALQNPQVNMQVAYKLSGGGTNFEPWRSASPGWGGPQGFLTNTQKFQNDAISSAMKVSLGKASANATFLSTAKQAANTGTGGGWVGTMNSWLTQQIGKPYSENADSVNTFDCSKLVTAAYKQIGINIPALTFSQMKYGVQVDAQHLQPGDLMLVHGSQGDFGHVGLYIGNGQVISAPHTGATVHLSPVSDWIPQVTAQGGMVRRLLDAQGRLIVGAGLTAGHSPSVQTVAYGAADMSGNTMTTAGLPPAQATEFSTSLNAAAAQQPPSNVLAPRSPITLPGFGKTVTLPSDEAMTPV